MLVVASANGQVGITEAMRVLKDGGSAVDAVEAGVRLVESNPDDHTVGYSGLPNLLGEVELDASVMDGLTLQAGAVGAVKNYEHAISTASGGSPGWPSIPSGPMRLSTSSPWTRGAVWPRASAPAAGRGNTPAGSATLR